MFFSGKKQTGRTMPTSVAHAGRRLVSLWNLCKKPLRLRAPQLGHIVQYRLTICETQTVKSGAGESNLAA
jgi:hypothetical protein